MGLGGRELTKPPDASRALSLLVRRRVNFRARIRPRRALAPPACHQSVTLTWHHDTALSSMHQSTLVAPRRKLQWQSASFSRVSNLNLQAEN
jgi:hypothetical protein